MSDKARTRNEALEEAAAIADRVSTRLMDHSDRAKANGDDATMYRANTAWHNTTGIAEAIRALKTKATP